MNLITPRAMQIFKTIWLVALGLWIATGLLIAINADAVGRVLMMIATVVTFFAFLTSFVILARAGINSRVSGDDS